MLGGQTGPRGSSSCPQAPVAASTRSETLRWGEGWDFGAVVWERRGSWVGTCDPPLGLVGGMPSAKTRFLPLLPASLVRFWAAGASFA